ncbi:hypothetical protein LIER_05610 [Lithospermum erythrorhizon]|uniref:No apical meristem-associated C-terminal domain-containing protein n=1 Tax=Lithospermum erythrorhizon TaxID=34254 RepID=A0AAV3P225_LITER
MIGPSASASSGSKRKSGDGDNISSSTLIRPEGRDETKKKAKRPSSKRRSNDIIEEEYSKMTVEQEELKEMQGQQLQAMQQVASAQQEAVRAKKMEMWYTLNQRKEELDEFEQEMWLNLRIELFGR